MAVQTLAVAVIAVVYLVIRYCNRTDIPKIKGLPEIPGVPIFGNLLQLGDQHATVAGKWAKKFGPVFQVRMGNKVGLHSHREDGRKLIESRSVSSLPTALNQFANYGSKIHLL
jgi:hypothetical protein